jgi:hypothetical protein
MRSHQHPALHLLAAAFVLQATSALGAAPRPSPPEQDAIRLAHELRTPHQHPAPSAGEHRKPGRTQPKAASQG